MGDSGLKNSEPDEIAPHRIRTTMLRTGWLGLLLLCFALSAEAQLTEQRVRELAEGLAVVVSTEEMETAVLALDRLSRVRSTAFQQREVRNQNLAGRPFSSRSCLLGWHS